MKKTNLVPVLLLAFISTTSIAQKFVLRETNLDPKKNSYYFDIAKKCEMFLQKKLQVTSLPLSSECKHTNNSLQGLSDYFSKHVPDLKEPKDYGTALLRTFKDDKQKVLKITYGVLPADQNSTLNFTQLILTFEKASSSPKILDMQIKSQNNTGAFTLSPEEVATLRKPPVQPVAKQKK
ncbi:MAG TPA: hypothetical protein VL728_09400 [Cyclobacteriaceae bacterium]|jgi:hypothetical protein|nr:hypothetical protein [Cyclobacteriaceae bacterium]